MDTIDYSVYSDLHKDVYGVRPRDNQWCTLTSFQQHALFAVLREQVAIDIEHDHQQQQHADNQFEQAIAQLIVSGANDRTTAIRWLLQAHDDLDLMYGGEYLCFQLGLSTSYSEQFDQVLNIMETI